MRIKDYKKVEKYHLLGIETYKKLAEKNPDKYERTLARKYRHIGIIYSNIKDYEKAEKYFALAEKIKVNFKRRKNGKI